ncbi:hypothetical protein HQ945_08525 [Phyllobacterium sp. BT25]|uniref:Uncharacterized protein n=1 Tax=Phyllobacterium pellucidum TaxID=2740464 RepID=A0A849VRL6_9HYPH|nr:hypothetical protein [Phyllobacterium pellucidum]NTS31299.1 hypothetical protein [Phyllobacterium pellucidum]
MAWVKAVIQFKPASIGTGIKATLRGKKTAILLLNIDMKSASALGVSDQDKVEVLLGDGPQHGMIRLRKNNSVGQAIVEKKATGKGDYFLIKLGHQAMFVNRVEPAKWCQWEKVQEEGGWFEIVLPKWADETRQKVESKVAALPAAAAPKGPHERAKAFGTVTSRLMGDPEPSRSALAQKG